VRDVYSRLLAGLPLDATEVNALDVCANINNPKQKGAMKAGITYRRLLQGISMVRKRKIKELRLFGVPIIQRHPTPNFFSICMMVMGSS
jgi:hypothetical protein